MIEEATIVRCIQNQPGISIREIMSALGIVSHSKLHDVLTHLLNDGILSRKKGCNRTLRVAEGVWVDSAGAIWQWWKVENREDGEADKTPQTLEELWPELEPGDVVYCYGDKPPYLAKGEAKEWDVPWEHMYEVKEDEDEL